MTCHTCGEQHSSEVRCEPVSRLGVLVCLFGLGLMECAHLGFGWWVVERILR